MSRAGSASTNGRSPGRHAAHGASHEDSTGGGGAHRSEPHDLSGMLDHIEDAAGATDDVSFDDVFRAVGRRSFGPILLLVGLVISAPVVGDIPGVPTLMALVVVLTAAQLLLKRDHFWLPRWLLDRSMSSEKVCKAIGWMRKPARFIDRLLKPRLTKLVTGAWVHGIALVSTLIGLMTPAMELVPFSANGAGAVLAIFGLALIAHDGLMALIALAIALLTGGAVAWGLMS